MRRAFRHRQRGQAIAFAAVAMVAIVGGLAIVVDAGIFFVIQRQFQTAADAAALAGAWHNPICPNAPSYVPPCIPTPGTPSLGGTASCDGKTGVTSCDVALANANTVEQLCGRPVHVIVANGTTLIRPRNVNTIVVTVKCDAGYSFGQILNLSTKTISASSAAALGNKDCTTGDMTDLDPSANPFCGFIARLID